MKAWVEYIRQKAAGNGGLWDADGYDDWYAPLGPTGIGYIDECFYLHSTEILANTAEVLGNTEDAATYSRLAHSVKTLFLSTYLHDDGSLPSTQTAYVLALQFDLLPESLRAKAEERLANLIHQNNDHLGTGFLGTPYLLWVLVRYGYTDLAFTLLKQNTVPSWLYPLTKGATTIWEKWDGIRPDGGFDVSSLNHYSYGAVGDWLYRYVAGIDAAEPGYRKIRIQPHVGGGLTWVKASYHSPYGTIVSNWKKKGKHLILQVVIPPNTTATILLPGKSQVTPMEVGPGHYRWVVRAEN
jgi:alpha-L-rhamnosidase